MEWYKTKVARDDTKIDKYNLIVTGPNSQTFIVGGN